MPAGLADRVIVRVNALKLALVARGSPARWLVPVVEAFEIWLTHGPSEVLVRARRRMGTRAVRPPAHYIPPAGDDNEPIRTLIVPPMAKSGGISIVIPVLNHRVLTFHCLAAIVRHTAPGTYEVIVVDNGSNEDTRAMLARVEGARVLLNTESRGFVEACNQGAAAARGEHVLFLNNDTAVLPGWLEALEGTLRSRPDAGAVGARLMPDGRLQEAGSIVWQDGEGWNYGKFADPEAPEFCYLREVDYCSGACLMVRRQLFEDLGGFDVRYAPAYYEDSDLCFRLRERGYTVLYQPAATVVHHEGATAGKDPAAGFKRYQTLNRGRFVERHRAALEAQHPHDRRLLRRARDRRPGLRVLVIDHMVPHHDQDSGSVRMAAMLRIFAELGHAVTFLPDNLARVEPYTTELQQEGVEVMYGPLSSQQWLEDCIADFDVVILCRAHFAAKYLSVVRSARRRPFTIFDTVNLHHLREERMAALEDDASLRAAAAKTREVEVAVMQACDMVWVTSTHEQQILSAYPALPPVEVVPNIHQVREDVPGPEGRRHLLFIGGFRHPPNEDAVVFFVEQVLPLVTSRLPSVQLLVVGSNVPPRIRNLASPEVAILGHVRDVTALFDTCRVSVAALRYGAGVKGKVSQSLAWGLPVVTTPIGAEGLDLVDREHAMIAHDPAELAERIIELYQDDALWRKLSGNGRRHVQAHLGPDVIRTRLAALLHQASQARGAAVSAAGSRRR